jgi:hypothetical protein
MRAIPVFHSAEDEDPGSTQQADANEVKCSAAERLSR